MGISCFSFFEYNGALDGRHMKDCENIKFVSTVEYLRGKRTTKAQGALTKMFVASTYERREE